MHELKFEISQLIFSSMPRPELALLHSLLGRPPHAPACRAPHTQRVLCSGAAATQRKAPRRPPRVGPQCLGSSIRCERGLLTPYSTPRPNQAWSLAKQGHPRGRGRRTWPQDAQADSGDPTFSNRKISEQKTAHAGRCESRRALRVSRACTCGRCFRTHGTVTRRAEQPRCVRVSS